MKIDLTQVVKSGTFCGGCKRPLIVTDTGKCLVCGRPQ